MFKSGFWFNFCGALCSVLWKLCLILDSFLYFLVLCTCNVLQMWSLLLSIVQNKWQILDSHSQQLFLKLWEGFMVTISCKFSIASTFFPKNPIIYLSSNRKIPSSFFSGFKMALFFLWSDWSDDVLTTTSLVVQIGAIWNSKWCDLESKRCDSWLNRTAESQSDCRIC